VPQLGHHQQVALAASAACNAPQLNWILHFLYKQAQNDDWCFGGQATISWLASYGDYGKKYSEHKKMMVSDNQCLVNCGLATASGWQSTLKATYLGVSPPQTKQMRDAAGAATGANCKHMYVLLTAMTWSTK